MFENLLRKEIWLIEHLYLLVASAELVIFLLLIGVRL